MNKTIIAAIAAVAFTSCAFAADLPSKLSAPVITEDAPVAHLDSISAGYGLEFEPGEYGDVTKSTYKVSYAHDFGSGIFLGADIGTNQVADQGALTQTIEGTAKWAVPVGFGVTANIGGGIGERFTDGSNYPYYALRAGADYHVNDNVTINAISYQYRNTFDTANDWESHKLTTGATFALNKSYSVYANVSRSFDADYEATSDAVTTGVTLKF